jgi:putative transposase
MSGNKKTYKTDVTDAEWEQLRPLLPTPKIGGRPRLYSIREIVNAIFYITRSGCSWRLMPNDLPYWKTVYHYFRLWRLDGTWERLNTDLREQTRVKAGRSAQPSAGIIDSQSVKTTGVGGARGYDGAKKVNGRKRHLLVDTQGFVLKVKVHEANISEWDGGRLLLEPFRDEWVRQTKLPRLQHIWVDGGYKDGFDEWVRTELGWSIEMVKHPPKPRGVWAPKDAVIDWSKILPPPGFRVLPRRWVVERTFAWLSTNRRLSKEYERVTETSEAFIYAASSRLMLKRLARN